MSKQRKKSSHVEKRRPRRGQLLGPVAIALVIAPMGFLLWHIIQDATVDVIVRVPKDREPCKQWVALLRESGLKVEVQSDANPKATLREFQIPPSLTADHTAVLVNGPHYVIEGHVPVDAIQQLRARKLPIHGLSVPGNPVGAPGFSGTGSYEIWAFTTKGRIFLFEKRSVVRRIAAESVVAHLR